MQISSDKQCANARTSKVQEDMPVTSVPGLALRVTQDGKKTWTLRYYRQSDGKRRRMTLGGYPAMGLSEAREAARDHVRAAGKGEDPANAKRERREAETFDDLFVYWYDGHAKRKLSAHAEEKVRYEHHIKPALGEIAARDLRRQDVAKVRDDVADASGPVQSNRVLALVNRILNYCVEEDVIEANIAARMRKAGEEKPRERVLTDEELLALWRELDRCEHWRPMPERGGMGRPTSLAIIRAVRLLVLTGQRRGEVIGAAASELALDGKPPTWTIPGERTKNGELHRVPLAPMALYEFRRAMAEAGEGLPKDKKPAFAFPSPKLDDGATRPDAVTKAMHRLCARIGLDGVGPHDLRRTVGTGLAKLRVPPDIRSLVLNHTRDRSSSETTRVYDRHGYDDEKLEALTKWEVHVHVIVAGAGANVVAMPART